MTAKMSTWRLALRALCAFALLFAAFAHQPSLNSYGGDSQLAQFALPDGTLPDICPAYPDSDPGKSKPTRDCEFCRIASSVVLPEAPTDFVPCVISVDLNFGRRDDKAVVQHDLYATAPPRGPPAVISNG